MKLKTLESEEICATLQDLATKYNLPNYHIQHHYNTENVNEVDDADEVDEVTDDLPINNFSILQETESEEAMDLELQTITPMPQMDVTDEVHEPQLKSTTEGTLVLDQSIENIDEVQFEMPQSQAFDQSLNMEIPPSKDKGIEIILCKIVALQLIDIL